MNTEELIDIYNDTISKSESVETDSKTSKYTFDDISSDTEFSKNGVISVIPHDTITSALSYKGSKVCILNMASARKAGGGVRNGRRAQEECLFRCTNLFETVIQDFYPLYENEALYTKGSIIIKDNNYQTISPYRLIDCVTIAAVNLNGVTKSSSYGEVMKNKIRLMLSLAYKNNCDTVILGAWGCGVFDNDPNEVSDMFYDILVTENMKDMFNDVVFGVINDHNSVANNYQIFKNKFNF